MHTHTKNIPSTALAYYQSYKEWKIYDKRYNSIYKVSYFNSLLKYFHAYWETIKHFLWNIFNSKEFEMKILQITVNIDDNSHEDQKQWLCRF